MENISKLLQLEHNCRNCESIKELYYQIVNETRTLVNYSQGVLLTVDFSGKYKVVGISDISVVDSTSPYVQWIENIIIDLNNNEKSKDIFVVDTKTDLKQIDFNSMHEFSPSNILFIPLKSIKENREINYILLLLKEKKWLEKDILILKHL